MVNIDDFLSTSLLIVPPHAAQKNILEHPPQDNNNCWSFPLGTGESEYAYDTIHDSVL